MHVVPVAGRSETIALDAKSPFELSTVVPSQFTESGTEPSFAMVTGVLRTTDPPGYNPAKSRSSTVRAVFSSSVISMDPVFTFVASAVTESFQNA
nr:hypothetical protein [Ruania alba]